MADLASALQHLLKAKRISAPSQSYRKDNPVEYAKVEAYLTGGARPTGVVTEMGLGLVEIEDVRRGIVPPPDPPSVTYPPSYTSGPLGTKNPLPPKKGAFLIAQVGGVGYSWDQMKQIIVQREADCGRKYDGVHIHIGGEMSELDFRISENGCQWIHDRGCIPFFSSSPNIPLSGINAGQGDPYYSKMADYFKAKPFTIMLRLMWEHDGNWFAWSGVNGPFITAWQRIVNLFKTRGATNVGFIWCPNERAGGGRPEVDSSYPGDAWVDWVASDIYNWGGNGWSSPIHAGWAEFWELFDYGDTTLADGTKKPSIHDTYGARKPFLVAESNTVYDSANPSKKGTWYRNIPTAARNMERLCGLALYDQRADGEWQVDYPTSNPDVYAGWKAMAADPVFNTRT